MKLRKILLVGICCAVACFGTKGYAGEGSFVGWQFFQDPVSMAVGFLAREWNRHTETIHYDVTNGLEKIKENIGMYRDQGKCGISATGNTGCDLTTPEQGAAEDAQLEAQLAVIPESTIKIITESEDKGQVALDGKSDIENKKDDVIGKHVVGKKGDKFDRVRANVTSYIFISTKDNAEEVDEDCTCSAGTGTACEPSECAQQRQNDALYQAALGASSVADTNLREIDKRYKNIVKAVSEINDVKTIADFVGKMGRLSVYGSDAVSLMMTLQTHDLRSQSYRNLMFGGINPVDLSGLEKKDTKGEKK